MPAPSSLVASGVLLLAAGTAVMVLAVFPWRADSSGGFAYEAVVTVCAYALVALLVIGSGGDWSPGVATCQRTFAELVSILILVLGLFFVVFVSVAAFVIADDDGHPVFVQPLTQNPAWPTVIAAMVAGVAILRRWRDHQGTPGDKVDEPVTGLIV
jgi:hypothetical protein